MKNVIIEDNKEKVEQDKYWELIGKIADRSIEMKIGFGDKLDREMDIDFAHEHYSLNLQRFLDADAFNFTHDFCGIQNNIDRANRKMIDEFFLPRFSA